MGLDLFFCKMDKWIKQAQKSTRLENSTLRILIQYRNIVDLTNPLKKYDIMIFISK